MTQPVDVESRDLLRLDHVSLAELATLDPESLAPVLDRVLRRADDPASITSGYNPQRAD